MDQDDDQTTTRGASSSAEARLARHGSISYLHIPASDVHQSASFYEQALGWKISKREGDHPGFVDGSGYVIGAWVTDQVIAREPGLLPYIYVDHIDATIEKIVAHGGEVVTAPYPEGSLWVATFRDPAGNLIGLWQEGVR